MIRWPARLACAAFLSLPLTAAAQETVGVADLLTAFVPDSGAATIPWAAGDELPVGWTAREPGKAPVPLLLSWNCGHDGCGIVVQTNPNESERAMIECVGG